MTKNKNHSEDVPFTEEENKAIESEFNKYQSQPIHFQFRARIRFDQKSYKEEGVVALSPHFIGLFIPKEGKLELIDSNSIIHILYVDTMYVKDEGFVFLNINLPDTKNPEVCREVHLSCKGPGSTRFAQLLYRNHIFSFPKEKLDIKSDMLNHFPKIVFENETEDDTEDDTEDETEGKTEVHHKNVVLSPSQRFQFSYFANSTKEKRPFNQEVVRYLHSLILSGYSIIDISQLPLELSSSIAPKRKKSEIIRLSYKEIENGKNGDNQNENDNDNEKKDDGKEKGDNEEKGDNDPEDVKDEGNEEKVDENDENKDENKEKNKDKKGSKDKKDKKNNDDDKKNKDKNKGKSKDKNKDKSKDKNKSKKKGNKEEEQKEVDEDKKEDDEDKKEDDEDKKDNEEAKKDDKEKEKKEDRNSEDKKGKSKDKHKGKHKVQIKAEERDGYKDVKDLLPIFYSLNKMDFIAGICARNLYKPSIIESSVELLAMNQKLRIIHFENCGIKSGIKELSEAIHLLDGSKIAYWNLSENKIKDIDSFQKIIEDSTVAIQYLNLSFCHISAKNSSLLFKALSENQKMHDLQFLLYSGNQLNNECKNSFESFLNSLKKHGPKLKYVDFSSMGNEDITMILKALNEYNLPIETLILKKFQMDENQSPLRYLIQFIQNSEHLNSLDLSYMRSPNEGSKRKKDDSVLYESLSKIINEIACNVNLKDFKLCLDGLNLNNENILYLFRSFLTNPKYTSSDKEDDLSKSQFNKSMKRRKNLRYNLPIWKSLSFNCNGMNDKDLEYLISIFKRMENLTELSFNDNFSYKMANIEENLENLLDISDPKKDPIKGVRPPKLTKISIAGTPPSEETEEHSNHLKAKIFPFLKKIAKNYASSIVYLDISNNHIGDEMFDPLKNLLHSDQSKLETLLIDGNKIKDTDKLEELSKVSNECKSLITFPFPIEDAREIIDNSNSSEKATVIERLSKIQITFIKSTNSHRKMKKLPDDLPFTADEPVKKLVEDIMKEHKKDIPRKYLISHTKFCEQFNLPLPNQGMNDTHTELKGGDTNIGKKMWVYEARDEDSPYSRETRKVLLDEKEFEIDDGNHEHQLSAYIVEKDNDFQYFTTQPLELPSSDQNKPMKRSASIESDPNVSLDESTDQNENSNKSEQDNDSEEEKPNKKKSGKEKPNKGGSRRSREKENESDDEDDDEVDSRRSSRKSSRKSKTKKNESDDEDDDEADSRRSSRKSSRKSKTKKNESDEDDDEVDSRRSSRKSSRKSKTKKNESDEDDDEVDTRSSSRKSRARRSDSEEDENRSSSKKKRLSQQTKRKSARKGRELSENSESDSSEYDVSNSKKHKNKRKNRKLSESSENDDYNDSDSENDRKKLSKNRRSSQTKRPSSPRNKRYGNDESSDNESDDEENYSQRRNSKNAKRPSSSYSSARSSQKNKRNREYSSNRYEETDSDYSENETRGKKPVQKRKSRQPLSESSDSPSTEDIVPLHSKYLDNSSEDDILSSSASRSSRKNRQ